MEKKVIKVTAGTIIGIPVAMLGMFVVMMVTSDGH